jgi:hypothetical protein
MRPDLVADALAAALRNHAAGRLADTAAIDLLTGHGIWLHRSAFREHIHLLSRQLAGVAPMAYVNWTATVAALQAGQLPCSGSEAAILRIAAGLGADIPTRLREVLGGLDHRNIALVTTAITRANGTRSEDTP